jgi:hypothetical protein
MRERCHNEKCAAYPHYGGRGITVCARWSDFESFLADMGERPPGRSLDRVDVHGNYEPSNCVWATKRQQNRNRTNNRVVEHNGKAMCIAEWSEVSGIPFHALVDRIDKLGWSFEEALTRPLRKLKKRNQEPAYDR